MHHFWIRTDRCSEFGPGDWSRLKKPFLTVKEAVREYSDAIKTVQPEGPYNLMGFSSGAVHAFELACQLQKRGERISYLGIIDASAPSPQRKLFNLTKGPGSHSLLATGHRLYLFMRNRLKTSGKIYAPVEYIWGDPTKKRMR